MKNKIKKIISIVVAISLTVTMFSCNKVDKYSERILRGRDRDKVHRIGLISDIGGMRDHGYNQNAWLGIKKFSDENPDVAVEFLQSKIEEDYAINIEYLSRHKLDLIIGIGFMMSDDIREAAKLLPDQNFALIDDNANKDLPNVSSIMFKQEQASYLVGIVAGLMTKTNVVGYVQGERSDVMDLFGIGFVYGVKSVNPKAKVIQYNAGNFNDRSLGHKMAKNMIENENVDIIYHAAGSTGIGVIKACEEKGRYAIGVDTDQSILAPKNIITSAIKRVDVAIYDICNKVINNEVDGGEFVYSLENGGIDVVTSSPLLTESVLKVVNDRKDKIKEGSIIVPTKKEDCPEFNLEDFIVFSED